MIAFRNTLAFAFIILLMISGRATHGSSSVPSSQANNSDVITNASIITDIKIYELGSKLREMRSDWAKAAQEKIEKILIEEFNAKNIKLKTIAIPKEKESEWNEIKALYNELSYNMIMRDRNPKLYPEASDKMHYEVGSIKNITKDSGSDYILYVDGMDCVSTAGRTTSKVALTVLGALVGVIPTSWGEITYLDMALINSRGKIVWHGFKASEHGYDLRDRESALKLVREILSDFNPEDINKPDGEQQPVTQK